MSGKAEAAAPPPPQPPRAAVFLFLFFKKGPFQGHVFPVCVTSSTPTAVVKIV
jgi:hypothetical protein